MKVAFWIVVFVVVGFFGVGLSSNSTPEGKAMTNSRRAIEVCWDEQQRKSLDPAQQRFIAGACEGMEAKFVAKYGHRP